MASVAVQQCSQACRDICAEIAKVARLTDEGRIAEAMYKPPGERSVPGFEEVTDPAELARLDLTPEDLTPSDSGFRAGVFRRAGTSDYVVGFKGTESMEDWLNNGGQAVRGTSDYYRRAQSIGRDVGSVAGTGGVGNVKFVGHSLGGGLASAAAHTSGLPATTFNSAGLHGFNRSWFNPPPIDAVRVDGEILTALQGAVPFLAPDAVGTPYRLRPPSGVGSAWQQADLGWLDALIPIRGAYRYTKAAIKRALDLHGMSRVNQSLAERAAELQQQAAAQGCAC